MIKTVTITGPDDSTDINDLLRLTDEYPFVEWGVLMGTRVGPRFPSHNWLDKLRKADIMPLSAHLCGRQVRAALKGQKVPCIHEPFPENFYSEFISKKCDRIQLNTHGEFHAHNKALWDLCQEWKVTPIIQVDDVNNALKEDGLKNGADLIFDLSHGAGVVCEKYPELIKNSNCTYAGGLGPDNLREEILKMIKASNGNMFSIDMETKIRTYDSSVGINFDYFDIKKVKECLEISKEFIIKERK